MGFFLYLCGLKYVIPSRLPIREWTPTMSTKKKQEITIRSSAAEYLTFMSTIGDQPDSVELRYQDENIWLTQRLMAELYGVDVPTINYHIQQIYKDNELTEGATIRNFLIVQTEGTRQVTREVKHYSLQMTMADWEERLNSFLKLWDRNILQDSGKISAELAQMKAETEFEKYRIVQDQLYQSNFDRFATLPFEEPDTTNPE